MRCRPSNRAYFVLIIAGSILATIVFQFTPRNRQQSTSKASTVTTPQTIPVVTSRPTPERIPVVTATTHEKILATAYPEFLALQRGPFLDEATQIAAIPPYVVPNIVHFIWFVADNSHPLTFINYISILSAHLIQKPQLLLLHCNFLPSGKWWRKLQRRVPLKTVHMEPPRTIFNQTIKHIFHAADIVKFQLIQTYGGIYLDTDVIVVSSLDPLRLHRATLGKEKPPKLIAGIVIGARGSKFFRLVYESYRGDYRPDDWDYNCARKPYQLYMRHRELLNVEPYRLTTPDFIDRHLLFEGLIDWHRLYVVHIMAHVLSKQTIEPKNIRTLQTTFGEVMRFIYYGSPAVRPG